MRIQASVEFMLIASAIAALSLGVISFYGKGVLLQSRAIGDLLNYSQPASFQYNYSSGTYQSQQQESYSAYISGRSEALSYPLEALGNVTNVTSFSHCAQFGFFGGVLDVKGQCGTYDAWEYRIGFSGCPITAYCVFAENTSYSLGEVGPGRTYSYDFTLAISSQQGTMLANLSSSAASSPILLGNETVGYARVIGTGSTDPSPITVLVGNGTSFAVPDPQEYSRYLQLKGELYSELSYYNSSGVSYDVYASIQQYMSGFIAASNALSAGGSPAPCAVQAGNYICDAYSPFSYLIEADLTGLPTSYNQTLYYLGSAIELRGA